jgi:hypothetical protein
LTSALLLSSEMILTNELRVSKESHSGSAPPQPFNKSKTGSHHKDTGCFLLNGFIGMRRGNDWLGRVQAGSFIPAAIPST